MSVGGVVLVGGRSRRFGSPKVDIPVGGETLLDRTRQVLVEALGVEPLVVGGSGLADLRPGLGPLAGIETALAAIDTDLAVVVACDMPGVTVSLVRLLATWDADADVLVPNVEGRRHPLCARWHRRVLPHIREALDLDRRSVHALLEGLDVAEVGEEALRAAGLEPARALFNVNTPEDLRAFEAGG